MKNFIQRILFSCMLFLTVNVNANEAIGWIHNVEVARVVVVYSGGVNVSVVPGLTGCVSQGGYGETFASVPPTHPALDKIYAALLSAQATGEKVSIYLGDNVCTLGEIVVGGSWF